MNRSIYFKGLNRGNVSLKSSGKQPVLGCKGVRKESVESEALLKVGPRSGLPAPPVRAGEARVGVEVLSLSPS